MHKPKSFVVVWTAGLLKREGARGVEECDGVIQEKRGSCGCGGYCSSFLVLLWFIGITG